MCELFRDMFHLHSLGKCRQHPQAKYLAESQVSRGARKKLQPRRAGHICRPSLNSFIIYSYLKSKLEVKPSFWWVFPLHSSPCLPFSNSPLSILISKHFHFCFNGQYGSTLFIAVMKSLPNRQQSGVKVDWEAVINVALPGSKVLHLSLHFALRLSQQVEIPVTALGFNVECYGVIQI